MLALAHLLEINVGENGRGDFLAHEVSFEWTESLLKKNPRLEERQPWLPAPINTQDGADLGLRFGNNANHPFADLN